MANPEPFTDFRLAARQLLTVATLTEREGQFCGGLAYRKDEITEKQRNWLRILLDRHALPALAEGGANNV
jgi:hypothetical protein